MKTVIKENVLGSKVTSGIGAAVALISLLGFQGDPAVAEAVHQWLSQNGTAIAQIVAVVALLFAQDPKRPSKPQDAPQVSAEPVSGVVRDVLAQVKAEQAKNAQGEE